MILVSLATRDRGIYTPEKMAARRMNIARFTWAKGIRDATLARAEKIAGTADRKRATWVPDPGISRAAHLQNRRVPLSGKEY